MDIEKPFDRYKKNIHSQAGEDGVIEEILNRLGIDKNGGGWCVEFGAWDGIYCSNTFALVEKSWNAVYIEGDQEKYENLLTTAKKHSNIIPINAMVARSSLDVNSLDSLLAKTLIPMDYDILSIDIDSYDLDVWESTTGSPKIVVIEINSGILPGIVWRHSSKTQGNSFTATINVAENKGYTLVCHTGNLIFVRNDLVNIVGMDHRFIKYPELLFMYDSEWLPQDGIYYPRRLLDFVPLWLRPLGRVVKRILFGRSPGNKAWLLISRFFDFKVRK